MEFFKMISEYVLLLAAMGVVSAAIIMLLSGFYAMRLVLSPRSCVGLAGKVIIILAISVAIALTCLVFEFSYIVLGSRETNAFGPGGIIMLLVYGFSYGISSVLFIILRTWKVYALKIKKIDDRYKTKIQKLGFAILQSAGMLVLIMGIAVIANLGTNKVINFIDWTYHLSDAE